MRIPAWLTDFHRVMRTIVVCLCAVVCARAQTNPVTIRVDTSARIGTFQPIYTYFGYDEPNYTYTKYGRWLINQLAVLTSSPVYVRTHFLLATGDGTPHLKWGSTNAYTEDAFGKPVYDWTITDRIFDTYIEAGAKPFVEIGFMPEALSSRPLPYSVLWVPGAKNEGYSAGWSYPPKDYKKWGELVYQWVTHCIQKYTRGQVASWYWEVWNEPDISYWHGTPEEYDKLYDYAADAVKRALPDARVGGPATTGGGSNFLRQFLAHCANGVNAATGKHSVPLDFISYHAKGRPTVAEGGRVRMGIAHQANDVLHGFEVIFEFPQFRGLPIVLSESDPEGCAACSAHVYPQNAYRNGALYASYTAAVMKTILDLADRQKANLAGMLTWAFEFEDQPYFDGFRTLATNGVDKPILNFFRMAGIMRGDRVQAESTSRIPLASLLSNGVPADPDVDALAVASDHALSILVWNYKDDDLTGADAAKWSAHGTLAISNLPPAANGRVLSDYYRIDETHSNAWTAWKRMGSPQQPTPEQYLDLLAAGDLGTLLGSPRWLDVRAGKLEIELNLPLQSVSLFRIAW